MKREVLTRPFDPSQVRQRQGQGGKILSYVETHAVIARLNEGCEAWSFEILEHRLLAEEIVVIGKLTADGVIKTAFGGSAVTRDASGKSVSIADDAKSAASDALKKAASLLGVGLELYGMRETMEVGNHPTPVTKQQQPAPPPGDRLTQRQLAAIYSVARRRNLAKGSLLTLLQERTGQSQPELLSRRQASDIIAELTGANGHG